MAIATAAAILGATAAVKGAYDANKAGKEAKRAAAIQAQTDKDNAEKASKAAREAAVQATRQQTLDVERQAALAKAETLTEDKPLENAEVQLDAPEDTTRAASVRKRRATFGIGSAGTGVNI